MSAKIFTPPYAPSWFDRLLIWLAGMGNWAWALLLAWTLFQFLYVNAMLWLDGITPIGTFDLRRSFFVVLLPFVIAVWLYLRQVARESFVKFRPALELDDAQAAQLEYALLHVPANETWLATLVGVILFGIFGALASPQIIPDYGTNLQTILLQYGWLQIPIFIFGMVGVGRGLYQLRMVNRIHRQAKRLNLFHASPLYAFSSLTLRISLSYLAVEYYLFVTRSDLLLGNAAVFALMLLAMPVAVACFILPLREMHQRIVLEKTRLLGEANQRFAALTTRVHDAIDANEFQPMDNWNKALANLVIERDTLEKIPTWPWERGTLTGFLTALILPIVLWLITRILERLL